MSEFVRRAGQHPFTVMRIRNQWVAECHTERHAGFQRPPMTNARQNTHILRLTAQNRIATSRAINQEMGIFAAHLVTSRTVRRCLQ